MGQTKEWILNNFPDPDGLQDSAEVYDNPIWWYGNIELHFNGQELFLIHSDYIETLDGGESLELKKWIFSEPGRLSLSYVLEQLNQQRIDFKVRHQTFGELSTVKVTVLKSGVVLGFSPAENDEEELDAFLERNKKGNTNSFRLHGFSLSRT